ncbi:retrovirus-related pol polyprotein from transposon TNT 1-94 [Tanacetum coccineum]
MEAIRILLAYTTHKSFIVFQIDVKTSFLHGSLQEDMYVCQPEGFIDADHPSHIYKLKKALYRTETCESISTLMEIKDKLDLDKNGTLVDAMKYRSMIGALMYLTMLRLLQEYFRWNSILKRKVGELVLEKTRLYRAVNRGSRICVSIRMLCSSSLDANTINGLWLSL